MKGKIEKVTQGTTKKNDEYEIYEINGAQYSNFDAENLGFGIGDEVNFEFKTQGKYNNLSSIEICQEAEKEKVLAPVAQNHQNQVKQHLLAKDDDIHLQLCLKASAMVLAANAALTKQTVQPKVLADFAKQLKKEAFNE